MNKIFYTLIAYIILGMNIQGKAQNVYASYAYEKPVDDYEFTDCYTGVKRSIHDPLNEGKYLYVTKMATWCPYCKENTKANFNKDTVAALLNKYKDKLEIWVMFDGPTDCNGAKSTLQGMNLGGAQVFTGVDNNDITSEFYSWGTPTILVFDPKTKRTAYQSWEYGDSFNFATKTLEKLVQGTFTYPTFGAPDNIVQFKKVKVSSVRSNDTIAHGGNYVTDGKRGTGWGSALDKAQGAWCMIDLGVAHQITDVRMRIGNSLDSKKIQIQIAENENGPWNTISELVPRSVDLQFKITSTQKARYFRVVNAEANPGFVLSIVDLQVKGINELTSALSEETVENIKIYPNPIKDHLNITLSKDSKFKLFNEQGVLVKEENISAGDHKIELKNMASGLYHVILITGNKMQNSTIIVE